MRNLILAAAAVAVVALSFATSTAMADHNHHSSYRPGCAPYATPYQAYRYSPAYSGRYQAYRSHYSDINSIKSLRGTPMSTT